MHVEKFPSRLKRIALGCLSLALAAGIWLPALHLFFTRDESEYLNKQGVPPMARKLAERHLALWENPESREVEITRMRASNAEWDFMGRTFLVLALADMGLRDPASRDRYLAVIDRIIADTLRLEKEEGMYFFLMNYAREGLYIQKPIRCQFIDGEIALMLGVRRVVEEKEEYRLLLAERVDIMVERMESSPVLSTESYPDECWMFDNVVALAAIRISDFLDGTDHGEFCRRWLENARGKLRDPETGLLIASFTYRGGHLDGPEGSTIWMVAHCLKLIDEEFARDQYIRAKKELARSVCGFGYAVEWPPSWKSPDDIDSGPTIPLTGASAGASGLAFVGASSFGDAEYLSELQASLDFAAFPVENPERLKYCGSNQVGDSVLLYAMVLGPVWEKVRKGN